MVYCFDLDDTICRHRNRDYENAIPLTKTIDIIRDIKSKDPMSEIIIHTSRGMNSCNGDIRQAEIKNRITIEKWLSDNCVPYDKIIFGKPLADVYIDDKAVNVSDFQSFGVGTYYGFSGSKLLRVGELVVKECCNSLEQYEWYREVVSRGIKTHEVPDVYSLTLGKLYMQHIESKNVYEIYEQLDKCSLIKRYRDILDEYKHIELPGENDVNKYVDYVKDRAQYVGIDIEGVCQRILGSELLRKSTFCHGDMSMSNTLIDKHNRAFLIDPSTKSISTWLLDASKIRLSFAGLEDCLYGSNKISNSYVSIYDEDFSDDEKAVIKDLTITHCVRVMYYAKKLNNIDALHRLRRLLVWL